MSTIFKSGTLVGSKKIQFTSKMVDVANPSIGKTKKTICKIIDENNNVISSGSVRLLSTDMPNNDIARKNAAKKALNSLDNKQMKKELYQWFLPLMQKLKSNN